MVYEKPFNQHSPAELERLSVLMGELGESVQVIGKILQYGYESQDPYNPEQITNRQHLEKELGDVLNGIHLLCKASDLDINVIQQQAIHKRSTIGQWLHHQNLEKLLED